MAVSVANAQFGVIRLDPVKDCPREVEGRHVAAETALAAAEAEANASDAAVTFRDNS
jgi:hypothetical protein